MEAAEGQAAAAVAAVAGDAAAEVGAAGIQILRKPLKREVVFTTPAIISDSCCVAIWKGVSIARSTMHPPLTIHRHPMCAEIIEEFQKCHTDHPFGKFLGRCTDLKIKLDKCFRQEKALKRKANFEESKKLKERLRAQRMENAEAVIDEKNFAPV